MGKGKMGELHPTASPLSLGGIGNLVSMESRVQIFVALPLMSSHVMWYGIIDPKSISTAWIWTSSRMYLQGWSIEKWRRLCDLSCKAFKIRYIIYDN